MAGEALLAESVLTPFLRWLPRPSGRRNSAAASIASTGVEGTSVGDPNDVLNVFAGDLSPAL